MKRSIFLAMAVMMIIVAGTVHAEITPLSNAEMEAVIGGCPNYIHPCGNYVNCGYHPGLDTYVTGVWELNGYYAASYEPGAQPACVFGTYSDSNCQNSTGMIIANYYIPCP